MRRKIEMMMTGMDLMAVLSEYNPGALQALIQVLQAEGPRRWEYS